jgi:hypothetical protein
MLPEGAIKAWGGRFASFQVLSADGEERFHNRRTQVGNLSILYKDFLFRSVSQLTVSARTAVGRTRGRCGQLRIGAIRQ